jgi:CheY-like chemotaxis protein
VSTSILVVDDEPDLVILARFQLEDAGYRVRVAEGGEKALRALDEQVPDAVLLDLRMQGVDGWQVLEHIRSRGRLKDVPVIVLSAHASAATVEQALELGCRGYVMKPFSGGDLVSALETALSSVRR